MDTSVVASAVAASSPAGALAAGKGAVETLIFRDTFESESVTPPGGDGPPLAIKVLNKAAYGPRPGDIAAFNALGGNDDARLSAWLDQQLNPDALSDTDCDNRIAAANYPALGSTVPQMWAKYVRGDSQDWPVRYHPAESAYCVNVTRAIYSRRQLFETMVAFWHSHFNVMGWEFNISPVFMQYDRDVMRGTGAGGKRHALGNFRALLEQVAKAPAMLLYLDNKSSKRAGYNENFARELCELHTLGAENYYPGNDPSVVPDADGDGVADGYCDNDVYEAARALTGWTMRDSHWEFPDTPEYDTGEYLYYAGWHDPASKYFLHRFMAANRPAEVDGKQVLDILAAHPKTALRLCGKLCRRFIGDNPPQALIESAAAIWKQHWQSDDQIARVMRHILSSDAFKTTWAEKVKRPWEAIMHAMRATSAEFTPRVRANGASWDAYIDFNDRIAQTGNGPFRWPTPDGFPDTAEKWQSVSPLSQTWRFVSRLAEMRTTGSGDVPFFLRIEEQTKANLTAPNRTATKIVDFWLGRIYGYDIDATRRTRLIDFLRQNAGADVALDLDEDDTNAGVPQHQGRWNSGNLSRHYTIARTRAMVALMLMLPEFFHR